MISRLTRRTLAMGALTCAVAGCTQVPSGSSGGQPTDTGSAARSENCRTPGELVTFDKVGQAKVGYEVTGNLTSMRADPAFLTILAAWADEWTKASGLGAITTIWSYGAYTDKCNSFHQVGRAFDIARIEHAKGTVTCRFDTWGPGTSSQLRTYWRLAASLHRRFAYTICYPYNAEHHNHIHVDNAVNDQSATTFDATSTVQVQLVQHVCRHVFGLDGPTDGVWSEATRNALRRVQRSSGITTPIGDPAGWDAFLTAAIRG